MAKKLTLLCQVESAQLASTIWHLLSERSGVADFETRIAPRLYRISHSKHPVVLWGVLSLSHYLAIVELGIQLNVEKQRRIANMKSLPKQLQRNWSLVHKSQDTLHFLKSNPPPVAVFPNGDAWTDPPPCMPDYYKTDDKGAPRDIVTAYRLYYAGTKTQITNLKWLPYTDEPPWLAEMKRMIEKSRKLREGLAADVAKFREKEGKKLERKTSSGAKKSKIARKKQEEEEEEEVEEEEEEEEEKKRIVVPKRKKAKGDSDSEWDGN